MSIGLDLAQIDALFPVSQPVDEDFVRVPIDEWMLQHESCLNLSISLPKKSATEYEATEESPPASPLIEMEASSAIKQAPAYQPTTSTFNKVILHS